MRNIFGSFDKADCAQKYIESMGKVTNAQFHIIQYQRDGKFEDVQFGENVKLYRMDKKYPGNTGKMNDWYGMYQKLNIPDDEWCIFTDMHDVVFQEDIPRLDDGMLAMVVSEGKKFGDIGFWKNIIPENMHTHWAYNCGVFAMNAVIFEGYLTNIHLSYQDMIDWKGKFSASILGLGFPFGSQYVTDTIRFNVGAIFNGIADTYIFNEYVNSLEFVGLWEDACCYNFSIEVGEAKMQYRKLCKPNGTPFAIAHYNGKNPITEVQK